MPLLLLILLAPLAASAQVSFDPVRLDDSTAISYAIPRIAEDGGGLSCLWAALSSSVIGGYRRGMSQDGDPLGGIEVLDAVSLPSQSCPPELMVLPLNDGGEARLAFHSCDGELVLRFCSSQGEVTDSVVRGSAMNPVLCRWGNGVLLAYSNYMLSRELILWFEIESMTVHEDTVIVTNVEYVWGEASLAKLVAFSADPPHNTQTICLHTFPRGGTDYATDTLLVDTLEGGDMDAGHVFACTDGRLTIAAPVVEQFASPLVYRVRVIRYQNGQTTAFTPWNAAALPAGSHIESWSLADGPEGSGVVGYYVRDDVSVNELRVQAFDAAGVASDAYHSLRFAYAPDEVHVTGLALSVMNESVYPLFTTAAADSDARGGVSLAAFPLSDLLAVRGQPAVVPHTFSLAAYPNPFNSSVRLDYSVSHLGPVVLRMFDITGRTVGERRELAGSSGQGTILWSMDGLPSGVYFARLSSGKSQTTTRLHLIR